MSGPIVTVASVALCPHGGMVQFVPSQARLLIAGAPAVTIADTAVVNGCQSDDPCIRVEAMTVDSPLQVDGVAVLTMTTPTQVLSVSGAPAGLVQFASGQVRVSA